MSNVQLILGDCIEKMKDIPDGSVDMVLSDIPYGEVSQKSGGLRLLDRGLADTCSINLEQMISSFVRICAGSFYVFCGTEQISLLVQYFKKHGLTTRIGVWEKTNPSPMNGDKLWISGLEFCVFARKPKSIFNEHCKKALWQAPSGKSKTHPTEKPVKLMQRLIEASTNKGQTVLDCTMGSGTTGVACVNTGRNFIGIELDEGYFKIAEKRITEARAKTNSGTDS